MKVDILAIGIHPDDVELSCSGTLLRHLDQGKTVGLLDLSRGEMGTRGTPEIREAEAMAAAELMGASFRTILDLADGFFTYSKENIIKIARVIRWCRPELVLANAPHDRHPDHGRASKLTADACFYSGLSKLEILDDQGNLLERWRPTNLYHYIQDYNLKPDLLVDITPYMDQKMELVQTFASQFFKPDAKEYNKELSTPISGKDFMDFLRAKAATYGREAGFSYAEGFVTSRTPGVTDLFALH